MRSDPIRGRHSLADDARYETTPRPDLSEHELTERLNPVVARSIVLVGSLLL
jgi:hypothetical protein